jgi:hypothetical protein
VWIDADAGRLRAAQAELLERLGRARLATDDAYGALEAAERGLDRDSLNEALWRLAMQAETELGLRESVGRRYALVFVASASAARSRAEDARPGCVGSLFEPPQPARPATRSKQRARFAMGRRRTNVVAAANSVVIRRLRRRACGGRRGPRGSAVPAAASWKQR